MTATLLVARGLKKHFVMRRHQWWARRDVVRAVDGVDLVINSGETLGLVGESGSGKSTVGRLLLRLVDPTAGEILFEGRPIHGLSKAAMRPIRRELQIVFQDPYSSLDPRMTAGEIVGEPLRSLQSMAGASLRSAVVELLLRVGLREDHYSRLPHEFSGGQRQRIGIARALALDPKLIVLDEPVSALDVSVQAQIVNLLVDLQARYGVSYLFISHSLSVVEHLSHRVAVMYLGKIVELSNRDELFARPLHPYTQALLAAAPSLDPDAPNKTAVLKGDIPSAINPPSGCSFHTRCPIAVKRCREEEPALTSVAPSRSVACHLVKG